MSFEDIHLAILAMLPAAAQAQARLLQHEVAVLHEALACVTDAATPDVIYGRVESLLIQRQTALLGLFQQARSAQASEANLRG